MKNMMTKSTLREIRGSFSRWISILAIVALGVGFFAGLKISKEAFILTGDKYIKENNLFDYQLISTLGFEDKNVDEISQVSGAKLTIGSRSCDAVVSIEDSDTGNVVAKIHTINDKINKPVLVAGSMPENENQCLADAKFFSETDIGKTITIVSTDSNHNNKDNESHDDTVFAYKDYTITGTARSPLYLNFERGSTSLGNGSVAFFLLIPEDGWKIDYYTEMYVDIDGEGQIFSDEYEYVVDSIRDDLTFVLKNSSNSSYDEIIAEASEKLADAEKQLKDAKKKFEDGEKELANNEKKLKDGENELQRNEQKLEKSREGLEQAKSDYKYGVSKYNKEKEEAYAQLDNMKDELSQAKGTPYYEQYLAKYQNAKSQADQQFNAEWAKLETARNQIKDGEQEISDGLREIEAAKQDIAQGKIEITNGKKELKSARKTLADAEEELDDARDEIGDIENPETYVLDRTTNVGYVCFENDTDIVEGLAKVFPVFFFLVAALVVMTTMTRMVDEQRTQIGVLKALGYSKSSILFKYIFYSVSGAVLGGLGGFIIGSYMFPWVIWQAYDMMYGFAKLTFTVDWILGALSILTALLCALASTLYSCYKELSEVPAQLIRPKAPALGKRILLERVHFIWGRLKFLHKVSIRNIFRYKKRFFMMVLGICGCTALLVTGLGISDSIKNVVSSQYDEIYHIDYTVTFDNNISEGEKAEFLQETEDVISDALFLYTISVDAHADGMVKPINMVVCKDDDPIHKFINLHDENGALPFPSKGRCIVNENLANQMGFKIGDTITVMNDDMKKMNTEIAALCENYVNNYIYINDETYEEFFGSYKTNSAFLIGNADENGVIENPHEDGALIMNADNVASVSITNDFRERISNTMKSLDYVIALVVACAGALAFIVLYNLTNINITERIREIATIKVLGFYPNETSAYVFRENLVLTGVSALVGLPMGKWLHSFVMSQIKIDMLSFDIHIEILSYVLAIIITFVFAAIVNFVMYFKLNKISMTESLKSIE